MIWIPTVNNYLSDHVVGVHSQSATMQLFARQPDGAMVPFQVDDDFPFPGKRFVTNAKGYISMTHEGKKCKVHRFVMGLKNGDVGEVDHKFGDIADNRTQSLRVVTRSQNNCFKGPTRRSTTGLKGVYKWKNGRYYAIIGKRIEGKLQLRYLGTFATKEEAALAYDREAVSRFAGAFLNFPHHIHSGFQLLHALLVKEWKNAFIHDIRADSIDVVLIGGTGIISLAFNLALTLSSSSSDVSLSELVMYFFLFFLECFFFFCFTGDGLGMGALLSLISSSSSSSAFAFIGEGGLACFS